MQARIMAVAALVAVCVPLVSVASGNVFDMGQGLTSLETVRIGNPDNADDVYGDGYGGVGYSYSIGKYEVTAGQYTAFLNAVAMTDTYGLFNLEMMDYGDGCDIQRNGSSGNYVYSIAADWANRPVNYVSWGNAARFANWLHNGQPTGQQDLSTTENGAYYLNGANDNSSLMAVTRKSDATWVIPTEDEWYKAAYYDGESGEYYDYPLGFNYQPTRNLWDPDPGNNANFFHINYLTTSYLRTEVGEFENSPSPYGTFDQGGNVWEFNETVVGDTDRVARGGCYGDPVNYLHAAVEDDFSGSVGIHRKFGFRVALVPEPATLSLLALGGVELLRRRRHK